ncbi:MAG: M56 family metallopeptidase [Dokdonella sp.]|uniref:M56 family metallopeptidase n=1 Tax=Dokdonella sp. TaxID=2291710 RepID=UPI003264A7E0
MNAVLIEWMPWVQALGWTLLHFVWQGLVVGAGFAAVRALLPRAHRSARYAAGLSALGLMTLWPVATFIALRPQSVDALAASGGADAAIPLGELAISPALAPIDHALPLLVMLWTVGVVLVAVRALKQWRTLANVARDWSTSSDDLDALLAGLSHRFRFMRRIRVLVSERIDTPMLIGWLKPIVLLPAAVVLGFPRQQIELILAHELGHLRRYDHLVNLGQALLETLLFYHPVVHWISREVRNERELCCDALVLRLTSGEPREYARTLAALEQLRQPTSVQVALAAGGGVLLERVRRIVGMPAPRVSTDGFASTRWLILAGFVAMGVAMAVRVERNGEPRLVGGLTIDWLAQPDVRLLPIAALMVPFEPPHLRLPAIVPPVLEPSPSVVSPVNASGADATRAAAGGELSSRQRAATAPLLAAPVPVVPTSTPVQAPVPADDAVVAVSPPGPEVTKAPTHGVPVAIRTVPPVFPTTWNSTSGRVDASFLIAPDGSVRDIRIADNGVEASFTRAAERALRQWRFDPRSLRGDRSVRFEQSFVFEGAAQRRVDNADSNCVHSTGSLICRPLDDAPAVATVAVRDRR